MPELTVKIDHIEALRNWIDMNRALKEFPEEIIQEMFEYEKAHRARPDFLRRMHQRLNKLRVAREREELINERQSSS